LRIAVHLYNESIKRNGKPEAVLNGKMLNEEQRKCMVWNIKRGASNHLEPSFGKQIPALAAGITTGAFITTRDTRLLKL
jgi:hypothetical protein